MRTGPLLAAVLALAACAAAGHANWARLARRGLDELHALKRPESPE